MHAHATKRTKGSKFSIRALLLKQGGQREGNTPSTPPTLCCVNACVNGAVCACSTLVTQNVCVLHEH